MKEGRERTSIHTLQIFRLYTNAILFGYAFGRFVCCILKKPRVKQANLECGKFSYSRCRRKPTKSRQTPGQRLKIRKILKSFQPNTIDTAGFCLITPFRFKNSNHVGNRFAIYYGKKKTRRCNMTAMLGKLSLTIREKTALIPLAAAMFLIYIAALGMVL